MSYFLITIYTLLHVYGSLYTYAENPFGFWLVDAFDLHRNHYDRIVHFSFGFLLAYPMREIFLNYLKVPIWVAWTLPVEITLSISGLYELVEWGVADIFFPEHPFAGRILAMPLLENPLAVSPEAAIGVWEGPISIFFPAQRQELPPLL